MYARRIGTRELTFDFAEGLFKDNLLVVDRETGSVWSQLAGQAIAGPLEGTPLAAVPALQTTWGYWRARHPETRVMIVEGEAGRPYFYRNRRPGVPAPPSHSRAHDTSALGLGLVVGGEAMFFPFSELDRAPSPLRLTLGGEEIVVHYRPEALTAWAEDREGRLRVGVLAYEDAWLDFHPRSGVFRLRPRGEAP